MARALAPASRSGCIEELTLELPPVPCMPKAGLAYSFPAPDCSYRTIDQSASSSSASIWGSEVSTPCPISERATVMMTDPSVPIRSQALGLNGVVTAVGVPRRSQAGR